MRKNFTKAKTPSSIKSVSKSKITPLGANGKPEAGARPPPGPLTKTEAQEMQEKLTKRCCFYRFVRTITLTFFMWFEFTLARLAPSPSPLR